MGEIFMQIVDTTNIHSVGYDISDQLLIVELNSGRFLKFENVPIKVYSALFEDSFNEDIFAKVINNKYDLSIISVFINV